MLTKERWVRGHGTEEDAARSQHAGTLADRGRIMAQVLQHVGSHNQVEGISSIRERRGAGLHQVAKVALRAEGKRCFLDVDAMCFSIGGEHFEDGAGATPDVEDAGAGREPRVNSAQSCLQEQALGLEPPVVVFQRKHLGILVAFHRSFT